MAEALEVQSSQATQPENDMIPNDKLPSPNPFLATQDVGSCLHFDAPSTSMSARDQTRSAVAKYLGGREQEWKAVSARKGPLNLLELPLDILRLIVNEMTHTNDLTALALTNSTLHNLAVPHIYARFDIVWPVGHGDMSDSKNVDALTYGLSTLSLGSSFARTMRKLRSPGPSTRFSRFKGNDYAKYTRNFSLGNGPNEWVDEYVVTKESGKMLGILVALAVAKMSNLETFVWDMPTGVLSDVFMSLASLPEHHENDECKLSRVWIRWHDNSEISISSSSGANHPGPPAAVVPVGSSLTHVGILLPSHAAHPPPRPPVSYSEYHVEYPTFSVLPPVKSLTVLEIDELAYLDEMAILIERSKDRLQELRVGISAKAIHKDFVQTWDGPTLHQVDHNARWPGESTIGERRLGGVLGVLVGRIYDIRRKAAAKGKDRAHPQPTAVPESTSHLVPAGVPTGSAGNPTQESSFPSERPHGPNSARLPGISEARKPDNSNLGGRKRLEGKLKLHTLELERIPLSMHVCQHAIDWSVLSTLTLLECAQHENLWKLLRKQFQPTAVNNSLGVSASKPCPNAPLQYHLSLKRIHTDITSPALISFIKETLAPNSLETLFLQDRRRSSGPPPVTIGQIFRGALKRHRSSLRKLLLDSAIKGTVGPNSATENTRWQNWVFTTPMLKYITSGRMSNLRELAVSIDYKDWHTFLQRLPNIPQLRSLNIPYIDNYGMPFEPKHLAMQVIDIITLRPEIQLCYMGISTKCFEILESRRSELETGGNGNGGNIGANGHSGNGIPLNAVGVDAHGMSAHDEDEEDEETSDDEDADDDDDEFTDDDGEDNGGGPGGITPTSPADPDETQSEDSSAEDSDDDSFIEPDASSRVYLRLREILFYDDKIAIFKARHARL